MLFGEETGSSVVLVCRLSLIQTIIVNICHFNVKFMLSPRLDFPLISFLIDGNVVIYKNKHYVLSTGHDEINTSFSTIATIIIKESMAN